MKQEMSRRGMDIAKRVMHAVGMQERGQIVLRQRLSRQDLIPLLVQLLPGRLGLAAWGGAPFWARRCRASGPAVQRMAPPCVKPYVTSPTNDSRDAEAIAEAVTRPTRRFVPSQDVDQQAIPALHRVHGPGGGGAVSPRRGRYPGVREGPTHAAQPGEVWEAR
jgi:transposase